MTPLPNSEIQPVKESELDSLHTLEEKDEKNGLTNPPPAETK